MLYVVLTGTPGQGFKIYGPFESVPDAQSWITDNNVINASIESILDKTL